MIIDLPTVVSLELIQNRRNTKSRDSLYGILNESFTPMGSRLLRANILQPSTERSKLTARYNAVEDLSTKEDMFVSVRQALKGFIDADRTLSSVCLPHSSEAPSIVNSLDHPGANQADRSVRRAISQQCHHAQILRLFNQKHISGIRSSSE